MIIIIVPVEVELALVIIEVQIRIVAVAIVIDPGRPENYTEYHPCHCPLNTLWAVFYVGASLP